jgi:dUTP pyrophosphatase
MVGPLKVKKLYPDAILPKFAYSGDAGADLSVWLPEPERKEGKTIYPGERKMLETGICVRLPDGYWGSIQHRSSTERRYRLRIVQGTIDSQYLGPLLTQVANENTFPITVHHGDRLAQLILHKLSQPSTIEEVDDLGVSDRGAKGFGSSGK